MIKVGHLTDFENYKEEIESVFGTLISSDAYEQLKILDHYYGENRNIYEDDGGYLVFLKDEDEWNDYNKETGGMLEKNFYENSMEEENNFVRVDYMTNNETMISVYMPEELFDE